MTEEWNTVASGPLERAITWSPVTRTLGRREMPWKGCCLRKKAALSGLGFCEPCPPHVEGGFG